MSERMDQVIDTYIEVWNTGNMSLLDDIVTADVVRSSGSFDSQNADGIDGLKAAMSGFRAAFPDTHVTIDERAYGDDFVMCIWTFSGTNTGPGEFEPTGRRVRVTGATIARFRDGRMATEDVYFDNLSFMRQLGFDLGEPATA